MVDDFWHFPRTKLAEQLLNMFNIGLSTALVFFAPRRMGKTEFLLKDIQPLAKRQGWSSFYFSFLDAGDQAEDKFTCALQSFIEDHRFSDKKRSGLSRIRKLGGQVVGIGANIELSDPEQLLPDISKLIKTLAENGKILLLLDEVQVLAKDEANENFIASLRTGLDMYKDHVKVIFTGSSREGLRKMFSEASAPFFHFGQNLPFPELDKAFTDHLADRFYHVTKRTLNKTILWETFIEMQQVPQLARSLVERLALNPEHNITETKERLLAELYSSRAFLELWRNMSGLYKLLLLDIAQGNEGFFGNEKRAEFANRLGIDELPISTVQSAIRSMQQKCIIGKSSERSNYFIDDPNFKQWLLDSSSIPENE